MEKKILILYKAFIAAIFISFSCTANAQSTLSAEEYSKTVKKLADDLKGKLNEIQRSSRRGEGGLWAAAEDALKHLSDVKYFYLQPNKLSLNWDIFCNAPYEKPSHLEPDYKKRYLVRVINKDGKGLYVNDSQPYLEASKYDSISIISFYDPLGRKKNFIAKLLTFEQLKELIKTSQIKVVSKRASKPFLDMTGSSINGGIGAAYVDVADSWLLKSSHTKEVINLPFGTFWTSTPCDGGLKCITIDVMASHVYEETYLNMSDEAVGIYAVELDYDQLLHWYKESLDYLMRDVNKYIEEQENKKAIQEKAFREADKKEPLGMLLLETATKLKDDKALFDYVITDKFTDRPSSYEISVIANKNTIRFINDFWKRLSLLEDEQGNIDMSCKLYPGDFSVSWKCKYNIATTNVENRRHINSLVKSLRRSSNNNISAFLKCMFNCDESIADKIKEVYDFYIHVPIYEGSYGIKIPCLMPALSKGEVIYTVTLHKFDFNLQPNYKDNGYTVKLKKE